MIIVALILLLIAALAFGGWAYKKMNDYKNVSDEQINAAAQAAVKAQAQQLQDNFDKQNVKSFQGSPTYGSITFNYPKTWSAYNDSTNNNEPINGYFYPDVVPGVQSATAFALRVELVNTDYGQILQQLNSQITQGALTARAYTPPKMQGVANVVAGTYFSGQINNQQQTQRGNLVVIKVRDKTLEIYSESNDFAADFNNIILASLTFAP